MPASDCDANISSSRYGSRLSAVEAPESIMPWVRFQVCAREKLAIADDAAQVNFDMSERQVINGLQDVDGSICVSKRKNRSDGAYSGGRTVLVDNVLRGSSKR
ncbi:hypothetical protein JDV02_010037 [Purpureocillium takamizusanense]|uniref:Uncharacterized protein n=1 Tax=Purpureocillium takamizusanense TaxID=2060973 RepID=A0A9Q8QRC8_9HYPO|nr:uncharacterized protein JDV02_010037 [Purpureocillium takamizusanense]UNI24278.1 hypothetical protein JDV02_010037 [Purpureocillium takamizusanense]